MEPGRRKGTIGHWLFAVYVLGCAGALTYPGYAWFGNRIEPFVFGLPFSLVWVMGWVLLTFGVLALYHAWNEPGGGKRG